MNSQLNSLHDLQRARFSNQLSSFEKAEAIYVERPSLLHVRVSEISYDEWGVKATIVDSLLPGMRGISQSQCGIAASWKIFSFSTDFWQANYVPWRLFFDPKVIRGCVELAAQANQKGSMIDWNEAMNVFSEYYLEIATSRLNNLTR
jgi:hypothetical protein